MTTIHAYRDPPPLGTTRYRAAVRAAFACASLDPLTPAGIEAVFNRELERDDATEEVKPDDLHCADCGWIGSAEQATYRLLRRGGPFTGPLDGATPDEYDDARCPECGHYAEEA